MKVVILAVFPCTPKPLVLQPKPIQINIVSENMPKSIDLFTCKTIGFNNLSWFQNGFYSWHRETIQSRTTLWTHAHATLNSPCSLISSKMTIRPCEADQAVPFAEQHDQLRENKEVRHLHSKSPPRRRNTQATRTNRPARQQPDQHGQRERRGTQKYRMRQPWWTWELDERRQELVLRGPLEEDELLTMPPGLRNGQWALTTPRAACEMRNRDQHLPTPPASANSPSIRAHWTRPSTRTDMNACPGARVANCEQAWAKMASFVQPTYFEYFFWKTSFGELWIKIIAAHMYTLIYP